MHHKYPDTQHERHVCIRQCCPFFRVSGVVQCVSDSANVLSMGWHTHVTHPNKRDDDDAVVDDDDGSITLDIYFNSNGVRCDVVGANLYAHPLGSHTKHSTKTPSLSKKMRACLDVWVLNRV